MKKFLVKAYSGEKIVATYETDELLDAYDAAVTERDAFDKLAVTDSAESARVYCKITNTGLKIYEPTLHTLLKDSGETKFFVYYLKAKRPLFGAVPSHYVWAENFGSAVKIPRHGFLFGLVEYEKPLSDDDVRKYDLKPSKDNPQFEREEDACVDCDGKRQCG